MKITLNSSYSASISYNNGLKFKIPSHQFPLKEGHNKVELLTANNTEPLIDDKIETIYNSLNPRMGRCYDNTQLLRDSLLSGGVEPNRIKTYVGWLFIGNTIPVHHSFIIIDDIHLLDYSVLRQFDDIKQYASNSADEIRNKVAQKITDEMSRGMNSERTTFGQAVSVVAYVASECSPEEGKQIRAKLLKAFPKHIAFLDVNGDTQLTDMQQRILNSNKSK